MTTWIILRSAGIGAYLMLWASVVWGLVGTTSLFGKRVAKQTAITVHQFISTVGLLLLAVHIGGLILDPFMPFHLLDVLVPLHAAFRPVAVGFGIAAMYAMVTIVASSWARKRVGPRWWRRIHLLTVPAFAMGLVHGVFTGTDTVRTWMWWTYVGTGGTVLFLTLLRGLTAGYRPQRAAPPAHARRSAGRPVPVPAPDRSGGRRVPVAAGRVPGGTRPAAAAAGTAAAGTRERLPLRAVNGAGDHAPDGSVE